MIENYRSGLLWDLFMKAPKYAAGLERLGLYQLLAIQGLQNRVTYPRVFKKH
jgi:hypothetical protein